MALQKIVWDSEATDLVLDNPDSGDTFRNTILEMLAVSPSDVIYQYENSSLIFIAPSGYKLTVKDVPFKGNPFHVQYFEQTGEWFGNNDAQVFTGVAGSSDYFAGNGGDDV
ncbi:hypothetical protein LZU85_14670, partial [Vibrio sp. IRLE0018]|uniref:hypothetical protein n=1 Tax=Vibrio floridensis TaxID=2908007 RepID=UPI001F16210B